jgi:hypothetical protein
MLEVENKSSEEGVGGGNNSMTPRRKGTDLRIEESPATQQ